MEQLNNKLQWWIIGILIAIIGFFCANLFAQIANIQEGIIELQLNFTKLQSSIITRNDVKEIVKYEIYKYKELQK